MSSSAEAMTTIRGLTEAYGMPMDLRDVFVTNDTGLAGVGLDVEECIEVPGVDDRLVENGVLIGTFVCRSLLANPEEANKFGKPKGEDVTLIRARLTYEQLQSDLSEGGTTKYTTIYMLNSEDVKQVDDYYLARSGYEIAARNHNRELSERFGGIWREGDPEFIYPEPGEEPQMPYMYTQYLFESPEAPILRGETQDSPFAIGRDAVHRQVEREALYRIQQKYPETTILNSTTEDHISQNELPILAAWLSEQAAR